jgi:hypothetical protein
MIDKKLVLLRRRLLEAQLAYDNYIGMQDVRYNNWVEHNADVEDEDLVYYCERFLAWYNQPSTGEER